MRKNHTSRIRPLILTEIVIFWMNNGSKKGFAIMTKFRGFCFVAIAAFSSGFSQTSAERITVRMEELTITLQELAKSTILQSHDTYFTNELFLSMIRQNPAIKAITKIDPDGSIANLVTGKGVSRSARNVSGERWFLSLTASQEPYIGISRDEAGTIFLFRAWPLSENSASPGSFVGVFTVKIDVKEYLTSAQKNETDPVQVLYNGTPLFSRNWNDENGFIESSVRLSESDKLVVRYKKTDEPAAALPPKKTVLHKSAPEPAPAAIAGEAEKKAPVLAPAAVVREKRAAAVSPEAPANERRMLTDSLLAASINPSFGLQGVAIFILLTGVTLVLAVVMSLLAIRSLRRWRRRKARAAMLRPEPIEAIMIPEEDGSRTGEDTRALEQPLSEEAEILSEISSVERETKELPALKELIAESSRKLAEYDTAADPGLRGRLLRDIHENLSVWVSGELRSLTGQLEQLSDSIRTCEKSDGHTAELQMLRYEIGRILEEIQGIDQRIAREILVK